MSSLPALETLERHYMKMAQAAERADWDTLSRIEGEAATLRAELEAAALPIAADEAEQASACILRILELDRSIRARTRPVLDEASQALHDARDELVRHTRSSAVHRAYGTR